MIDTITWLLLTVLHKVFEPAGGAGCSCCFGACCPACTWVGGGRCAGTPYTCGAASAISYLYSTSIMYYYVIEFTSIFYCLLLT